MAELLMKRNVENETILCKEKNGSFIPSKTYKIVDEEIFDTGKYICISDGGVRWWFCCQASNDHLDFRVSDYFYTNKELLNIKLKKIKNSEVNSTRL